LKVESFDLEAITQINKLQQAMSDEGLLGFEINHVELLKRNPILSCIDLFQLSDLSRPQWCDMAYYERF
jgi:hypothetical protein